MLASSASEHSTHALLQDSPSTPPSAMRPERLSGLASNSSFTMMLVLVMFFAEVALCRRTCAIICLDNLGRSFISRGRRIRSCLIKVIIRVAPEGRGRRLLVIFGRRLILFVFRRCFFVIIFGRRIFIIVSERRLRRGTRRRTPRGRARPTLVSAKVASLELLVAEGAQRRVLSVRPIFVWFTVRCQTVITEASSAPTTIHARSFKHARFTVGHDFHFDASGPSRGRRGGRGTRPLSTARRGCGSSARTRHGRSCPRPRGSSRSFPRPPCFLRFVLIRLRATGDHGVGGSIDRQGERGESEATHS